MRASYKSKCKTCFFKLRGPCLIEFSASAASISSTFSLRSQALQSFIIFPNCSKYYQEVDFINIMKNHIKVNVKLTVLNWRGLADWIFGLCSLNIVNIFFEAASLADHIDPGVHFFPRVNRQEVTAGPCINAKHEVVVSFSIHQAVLHLKWQTFIFPYVQRPRA